jgi:hypothetical protein
VLIHIERQFKLRYFLHKTWQGNIVIPDRGKRFFSHLMYPDQLWGPPSLPFYGYWGEVARA